MAEAVRLLYITPRVRHEGGKEQKKLHTFDRGMFPGPGKGYAVLTINGDCRSQEKIEAVEPLDQ
jgi:hypothetical protein